MAFIPLAPLAFEPEVVTLPEVKGAAAHQKRAIPTIDNDEKFLLFDPPPDARLPAQRAALLFYLDAAIRLPNARVAALAAARPTPSLPPAYALPAASST